MPRAKKTPTDETPATKPAAKKRAKKASGITAAELDAFVGIVPRKPEPKGKPTVGIKVAIRGRNGAGYGEVMEVGETTAKLRFCTDTVNFVEVEVPIEQLVHGQLPNQTRVFHKADGVVRFGRVMATKQTSGPIRSYLVHFPGGKELPEMQETDFSVRSYLAGDDPSTVLAELAQETPFFFQQRSDLLSALLKQNQLSHGLPGLLSSKVEVLQHQAEVADRVLHDPVIRYLLADEVGLGKTIEAGMIMRQIRLDAPDARIAVIAPDALTRQWREELDSRFGLDDVELFPHSAMESDEEDAAATTSLTRYLVVGATSGAAAGAGDDASFVRWASTSTDAIDDDEDDDDDQRRRNSNASASTSAAALRDRFLDYIREELDLASAAGVSRRGKSEQCSTPSPQKTKSSACVGVGEDRVEVQPQPPPLPPA